MILLEILAPIFSTGIEKAAKEYPRVNCYQLNNQLIILSSGIVHIYVRCRNQIIYKGNWQ